MEVALVSPTTIRIKGKVATFLVDPVQSRGKLEADAVLLLNDTTIPVPVENSRLTIIGPGEYEISGVKITGISTDQAVSYFLTVDNISVLVGKGSALKGKESLRDVDVAILLADSIVDQSAVTTVTSGVALFYGENAAENVKALGKEAQTMSKYTVTKEKLPQEMEVVLLA